MKHDWQWQTLPFDKESWEALWFASAAEEKRNELCRYQAVEHPRRMTSDRYLDLLG